MYNEFWLIGVETHSVFNIVHEQFNEKFTIYDDHVMERQEDGSYKRINGDVVEVAHYLLDELLRKKFPGLVEHSRYERISGELYDVIYEKDNL